MNRKTVGQPDVAETGAAVGPDPQPHRRTTLTEYEAATLAFREASLAAQHAGLWIAAAHVAVGLIQAGIVWYGIRAMQRAGERRATEQDQRHAEAMQALDVQRQALETLIARSAS